MAVIVFIFTIHRHLLLPFLLATLDIDIFVRALMYILVPYLRNLYLIGSALTRVRIFLN